MGWEARERGGRYYTRSRREGGRVVREYIGAGPRGELAALADEEERAARQAARSAWEAQRAQVAEAEAMLLALCEGTDALVAAVLAAAGYHQHHRGEWRKRREQG